MKQRQCLFQKIILKMVWLTTNVYTVNTFNKKDGQMD